MPGKFGFLASDLRGEAADLLLELTHVRHGEGRIERGERLPPDDALALSNINAFDNGRVERLDRARRLRRHDPPAHAGDRHATRTGPLGGVGRAAAAICRFCWFHSPL